MNSELVSQMGMQKHSRRLKVDAVPTLFERPGPAASQVLRLITDPGPSGNPFRKTV